MIYSKNFIFQVWKPTEARSNVKRFPKDRKISLRTWSTDGPPGAWRTPYSGLHGSFLPISLSHGSSNSAQMLQYSSCLSTPLPPHLLILPVLAQLPTRWTPHFFVFDFWETGSSWFSSVFDSVLSHVPPWSNCL